MSIHTCYLNLVNQQIASRFSEKFSGSDHVPVITLQDVAEATSISFSNPLVEISYSEYQEVHDSNGSVSRRVTALPKALLGVVAFLANVVAAVIFSSMGLNTISTVHFYRSGRSLQEVAGHAVMLFNESYGSYLVASAQVMDKFHQYQHNRWTEMKNPLFRREVELLEQKLTDEAGAIIDKIKAQGDFKVTISLPGYSDTLEFASVTPEHVKKVIQNEVEQQFKNINTSTHLSIRCEDVFAHCKIQILTGKFAETPNAQNEYAFEPEEIIEFEHYIVRDTNGLSIQRKM